ncbi:hypothetical protein V6Z92_008023 [Aspergillus fumigatus]
MIYPIIWQTITQSLNLSVPNSPTISAKGSAESASQQGPDRFNSPPAEIRSPCVFPADWGSFVQTDFFFFASSFALYCVYLCAEEERKALLSGLSETKRKEEEAIPLTR